MNSIVSQNFLESMTNFLLGVRALRTQIHVFAFGARRAQPLKFFFINDALNNFMTTIVSSFGSCLLRPLSLNPNGYRNIDRFSIDDAFQPNLRS